MKSMPMVRTIFRPLLRPAMLVRDDVGPLILVDCEQSELEQARSVWHEVYHLLTGSHDEAAAEAFGVKLADACPEIVKLIAAGNRPE